MSLKTDSKGGNYVFCKIMNGKIVVPCKEGDANAVPRILEKGDRKGQTVYEQHYTGISGDIRNVSVVDGKFGKELHIHIVSNEGEYVIQMGLSDTYATAFLTRLPNMDFNKPVEIRPYLFKGNEGTMKPWLTVYQDEEQVPVKWDSKSDPKEFPKLEEVVVSGKKTIDSTKRMEFFEKFVYDKVVPILVERWKEAEAADNNAGAKEFETATTNTETADEPSEEELAAAGAPVATKKKTATK